LANYSVNSALCPAPNFVKIRIEVLQTPRADRADIKYARLSPYPVSRTCNNTHILWKKKNSKDYVEIPTIQPATRHFVDIRFKRSDSERICTYHFQGPDQWCTADSL